MTPEMTAERKVKREECVVVVYIYYHDIYSYTIIYYYLLLENGRGGSKTRTSATIVGQMSCRGKRAMPNEKFSWRNANLPFSTFPKMQTRFVDPIHCRHCPIQVVMNDEEEEEEEAGPSPESLVKLAKLEPLPPLLAEFDLDAHVGLIQKLLKVDDMLVEQQSKLSGECINKHCCVF